MDFMLKQNSHGLGCQVPAQEAASGPLQNQSEMFVERAMGLAKACTRAAPSSQEPEMMIARNAFTKAQLDSESRDSFGRVLPWPPEYAAVCQAHSNLVLTIVECVLYP